MPLDMTNENEVAWQLVPISVGSERTVKSHSMRRSRAKLYSLLTPEMKDASREIDQAYEDRSNTDVGGYLGYTSQRERTGGVFDLERMLEEKWERARRLKKWQQLCPALLQDVVYALNQMEHTATTLAAQQNKTTMEITLWYKEGLRVYCKLQGWI